MAAQQNELFTIGQPLNSETGPFERVRHDHVVQERCVLLPYFVLFIDLTFFGRFGVGRCHFHPIVFFRSRFSKQLENYECMKSKFCAANVKENRKKFKNVVQQCE